MKIAKLVSYFFKFISLIFVVFIIYLFMSLLFPALGNPANVVKCRLSGGKWIRGVEYMCIVFYDDGGTQCASNKDCKGLCLVENNTDIQGLCSDSNYHTEEVCYLTESQKVDCYDPLDPWGESKNPTRIY